MIIKKNLLIMAIVLNLFFVIHLPASLYAQSADDETATFISVAPDALILLDLSGSMNWNPAGSQTLFGRSSACTADTINCSGANCSGGYCTVSKSGCSTNCGSLTFGDSSCASSSAACTGTRCSGGYCAISKTGCDVNCSRLEIAKRAIASMLDDDNNGVINAQDSNSLNIRLGYSRFHNGAYSVIRGIGTTYQQIFCGVTTATGSCAINASSCSGTGACVAGETATGGTPLSSSMVAAKTYLDNHKASDDAKECRKKFLIVISDGDDTIACGGSGAQCQSHMYKRRRATVAAAKALYDAGYKVFMIGFGEDLEDYSLNTLNWSAFFGGTDNPEEPNVGNTSAYTNVTTCDDSPAQTASCQGTSTTNFRATTNDPGYAPLSGYAFLATNADNLTAALRSALATISAATYSFTQASIQAVRTVDENYVYEASFQPIDYDPFWVGHLKRYSILANGTVNSTADWDAGVVLSNTAGSARNILTYKSGSLISFTSANVTAADLGVSTAGERDAIVNYIRNGETIDAYTNWKLGDIFHGAPLSIATPNVLFFDQHDRSNPKAFNVYRESKIRSSANGKRVIAVGSNNGQLHLFKTGDNTTQMPGGGGTEVWSFIPPNLLPRLRLLAHTSHPTLLTHQYFVDGPLSAAEVWLGSGTIGSTFKSANDWHTYLVMSQGRGGNATLWSSSSSCDSGFSSSYSSSFSNYCGYYAFRINETLDNPVYQWRIGGSSGLPAADGAYLGQPWSKMFIGRVRINNSEKWVGLIGGGYSGSDCKSGGACDTRGKSFYVIDMSNGAILWRYTYATNSNMAYSLPASPSAVDSDNDGFLDTAYIADLGGNVWRFKFCLNNDGAGCNTINWSGGLFFETSSGNIRPIYTSCAVTVDPDGALWVYFGSGDKTDPTAPNAQEKFYAVKDTDRSTTWRLNNLKNITSSGSTYNPGTDTDNGWYINITGGGEKILSDPTIFEGNVYFTTYNPPSGGNPCEQGGESRIYTLNYLTGRGVFSPQATAAAAAAAAAQAAAKLAAQNPTAANIAAAAAAAAAAQAAAAAAATAPTVRSQVVGMGIASGAVISRNPGDEGGKGVYVSTSVITGAGSHTQLTADPTISNTTNNSLIYWQDMRVR